MSTLKASQDTSIETQEAQLREIAARRGWEWVGWFSDRSSGKTLNRPGLNAALDLLFKGKADVLIVHNLDRLGRNAKEMLDTVDALAAAGKKFYAREEEIDTTGAMGRVVFTIFAGIAEFYRRRASEGIRLGLARARELGRVGGRPRSIDYARLPEAGFLRTQGLSWKEIAKRMKSKGSGQAWALAWRRRHAQNTVAKAAVNPQNPGTANGSPGGHT